MGNLQTLINYHAPLNYAEDLNKQLVDQGMLNHPGLGQIQLWKIKQSNLPMLFSFHIHIYEKDSSIIQIHNFRCSLNHPNLIEYFACTSSKALNIGKVQSQQFFFLYHQQTLKQYISTITLTEVQIWNIIEQIVDVMVYLQSLNRYHSNINSESIFMTDNFKIKLLDKIGQQPNKLAIKEDVHDLGIVIIELLTKKTNQLNFIQQIKNLSGKFTLQLLQLVAKMIDDNIDKRPDFIQIQKLIQNRLKEPIFYKNPLQQGDYTKLILRLQTQGHQSNRMNEIKEMKSKEEQSSPKSNLLPQQFNINQTIKQNNTQQNFHSAAQEIEIIKKNQQYVSPSPKQNGKDKISTNAKTPSSQKQMIIHVKQAPMVTAFSVK